MKASDNTRSIFDDDPLLATEKKKFYPRLGTAWLIPVYSFVLFLAFWVFGTLFHLDFVVDKLLTCVISIVLYGCLLLTLLFYSYNRKKKIEPDYKLRIEAPSTTLLLAGPFLMCALYVFVFGVQEWLHLSMLDEWESSVFLLIRENPVFYCFTYLLIDPLIEESLMRGVVLDSFFKNYSPVKSIVNITAISCAISLSPNSLVYVISFSVLLSWIYLKTKNLGNTLYMQFLFGLVPALLIFTLQDQFIAHARPILNSPAWVGISAIVAIICVIILQSSFSSTNKTIS
ncbi:type II CAAX endopeptidase family protein [Chitinophaga sp.]|uniref:CPBP family intramembrane glutamic endopeptidase n=1 Tax=Chitinophaga sp. TaxID=1869181 RepID=UPI002F955EC7